MAKPLLFAEKCSTCIFRPGNLMHLQPDRLADLAAQNQAVGSMLICHKTTHGQAQHEAMCRGYWDAYADTSAVPQVMERMFGPDWYEEVPAP